MGNYGRLGHYHGVSMSKPSMIDLFRKKRVVVKDIKVGGRHTFAITDKHELYAWGFGYYYQLGTSSQEDCLEPTKINLTKKVASASCGYFHSALILENQINETNSD
uniref:Uncharacterized protein n=1 Tax=Euplotes harpa TaxID=151035 RepID=A0A7S3N7B9_9SPIT|mmetsp:Transcript_1432/g.1651  ORF Transcript_1432/g.1651 Transcript_1432/m.1651 type:complete len:106 (+) Transcript_1432:343-660(+)